MAICLLEKRNGLLHDDILSSFLRDDSASELSLTDVSSDELFSEPEIAELAGAPWDNQNSLNSIIFCSDGRIFRPGISNVDPLY